jgi:hypothetical protein
MSRKYQPAKYRQAQDRFIFAAIGRHEANGFLSGRGVSTGQVVGDLD